MAIGALVGLIGLILQLTDALVPVTDSVIKEILDTDIYTRRSFHFISLGSHALILIFQIALWLHLKNTFEKEA